MNIDISPELEKAFKKYVLEKHGELGGKLGEEMEKAISLYLIHESAIKTYVKKKKAKLEAYRKEQIAGTIPKRRYHEASKSHNINVYFTPITETNNTNPGIIYSRYAKGKM